MAVNNLQVLDIIDVMEAFLESKRPPETIRNDASKIMEPEVAKATFVEQKIIRKYAGFAGI